MTSFLRAMPAIISRTGYLCVWSLLLAGSFRSAQAALPEFDFRTVSGRQGWVAQHDISALVAVAEGLQIRIAGTDPYLAGPSRDYPGGMLLWLNLRLFSQQAGICQVFYYRDAPSEEHSVRFFVPAGQWYETRVPVPALGRGYRLRIDPPGTSGTCTLSRLWFQERVLFQTPEWPVPENVTAATNALTLQAGTLRLRHNQDALGAFALEVEGRRVAVGNSAAMVGYTLSDQLRWFSLSKTAQSPPELQATSSNLNATVQVTDPDGATWRFSQRFAADAEGVMDIESTVSVDRDREVLYLPMVTLLAGVGSWGTNKHQGIFAGVEYLDNEPSSSEKDLQGPESRRLVPDTLKTTFPLMAIEAEGAYVGLIWEPQSWISAVFDSPDRQFRSGGHLLSLILPGSNGSNREQNNLLPYDAMKLAAGSSLTVRATIIGAPAQTIVPAVQRYVELRGLPDVPSPSLSKEAYWELAAQGWLDSRIRETNLYRHAFWPGFSAQPASDAALWQVWLSRVVSDSTLAVRLTNAAADALTRLTPSRYNSTQVGHITTPAPALVFGSVLENAAQAEARGMDLLTRFEADGTVVYQPQTGGTDYARTHWERHANGLTASVVHSLLEAASFSGDRALIDRAIKQLKLLDRYTNSVPRGAQTWEIPLHTPDILASAHLTAAYLLGYELTGNADFLAQAQYWAWTGVPFVYLHPPVDAPIGLYATIPVLGATGWVAPVWIGLPVQWCGLVYADALHRLAEYDPTGPWRKIADGIAVVGVDMSWPRTDKDRQGLLPDIFHLRTQMRDGPAINPATVLLPAIRFFGEPAPYDYHVFRGQGLRVHAPGEISEAGEGPASATFRVKPWLPGPCRVMVNGLRTQPSLEINGRKVENGFPHQYLRSEGRLVILIEGDSLINLGHPAEQALNLRRLNSTGILELGWPVEASNSVVEVSDDLSVHAWQPTATLATRKGGEWVLPVLAEQRQQYFRLRRSE